MEECVGAARARYCVPSYSAGESRDLENLNYLFYTRGLDQSCHPPTPTKGMSTEGVHSVANYTPPPS